MSSTLYEFITKQDCLCLSCFFVFVLVLEAYPIILWAAFIKWTLAKWEPSQKVTFEASSTLCLSIHIYSAYYMQNRAG